MSASSADGGPDSTTPASDGSRSSPDGAAADGSANADAGPDVGASVLEHHLHSTRDGAYTDPNMTTKAAAGVHIDPGFNGKLPVGDAGVAGNVYGHPLYVDGWKTGQDAVFVATDQNHVTALDATTGAVLWDTTLGPPVPLATLPCGQPYPFYGVNSTPIIDLGARTLYTESFQTPDGGATLKHYVYALSIDDGTTNPGWPVDVGATVSGFAPGFQQDRGALALLNGTVYVPYAGLNGDCGSYHGWIVGISTTHPTQVGAYSTAAAAGGIWGAVSTDGTSVYAVTGNTTGTMMVWGGGEALLRVTRSDGGLPESTFSGATTDYFTPSNWPTLDAEDADLGSSAAILFDMPGATPPHLAAAMGKFGVVHLLNRDNLGGVGKGNGTSGEGLFSLSVVNGQIKGTPATYTSTKARYIVVRGELGGPITVCPNGQSGDLLALSVTATAPPTLVPAWCAQSGGKGSPIATTTDGTSNAIVWIVSTGGTNNLLALDGDTGAVVVSIAPPAGATVQHWTSPVVAKGRFIVGGTGAVYAFTAL
jgi:outer membrane protein assembly factor BamB